MQNKIILLMMMMTIATQSRTLNATADMCSYDDADKDIKNNDIVEEASGDNDINGYYGDGSEIN